MSGRSDWRWGNPAPLISQSLPRIIKCSHHLVSECHVLSPRHFLGPISSTLCFLSEPVCVSLCPSSPWVMTGLTSSKPAECQYQQTYRGPVFKAQETTDGPAEAAAAATLPPSAVHPTCRHLLGCQNNRLTLVFICMHSLVSSLESGFCPPV